MPRCPLNQAVRKSSELCRASPRTRAHPGRATSPFADGGTRPHRIITPSDSRSCIRTTGTLCDTATLKRTENCHQGCATESSLSASARSGITNRSLIECERTTDQPLAGNVRARRQWIPSHGSALPRPPGDFFAVEALHCSVRSGDQGIEPLQLLNLEFSSVMLSPDWAIRPPTLSTSTRE